MRYGLDLFIYTGNVDYVDKFEDHELGNGIRADKVHKIGYGPRAHKVKEGCWQDGGTTSTGVLCQYSVLSW